MPGTRPGMTNFAKKIVGISDEAAAFPSGFF
jgi:hypothetical protein